MAYEYSERQLTQWDWAAQAAAWKEKAEHEARRAAFYQRKAAQYEAQYGAAA
ncbi:hypothetical protein [Paenarthrobacter histidinolovorans]|uniref:hypothetical protein n=1 Tax=Paenarthrobacter histidinolovorans TaxID=43664 RepID=UPI00166E29D9|nr:hypothetical protein [Paenarthrobacter histidinolovorans]GGJ20567.1 hypothetical protein GCM10010052_17250 [Paenarthrobacter histidinolovorans]